ncbi:signal peptide peptidase SppA [Hoeflea sp. CAU 1731]
MDHSGITDRRRLRRKLTFWRIATLVAILAVVAGLFFGLGEGETIGGKASPHIARVTISGVITDNQELQKRLDTIAKNDNVQAVILRLNSPGGTSYGGEVLYKSVLKLGETKPVVADVRTLAASAAYMIACGTDYIVAGDTSIVGSIGVIFQYAQVQELLDKIGVKIEEIKSAPLKAEPSPFHEASAEAKQMIDSMITDSYDWFVTLVSERRKLPMSETRKLADGSIFTGRQAADNGLIDVVGGEEDIRKYLAEQDIDDTLDIIDWEPRKSRTELILGDAMAKVLNAFGQNSFPFSEELKALADRKLFLDGLVSVWHFGEADN